MNFALKEVFDPIARELRASGVALNERLDKVVEGLTVLVELQQTTNRLLAKVVEQTELAKPVPKKPQA